MAKRSHRYKKTPIYGNCLVISPDEIPMFRCDDNKSEWYLSRNLAEVISIDPPIIRLKFTPKGKGHFGDNYYLGQKQNKCVVCGSGHDEGLTRHHIVPFLYRRLFPDHLKHYSSHDIVPLCGECHGKYEKYSYFERVKIGEDYEFPYNQYKEYLEKAKNPKWFAQRAVSTLNNYGDQIPEDRKLYLKNQVEAFTGKPFQESDLVDLMPAKYGSCVQSTEEDPNRRHARLVIKKVLADNALDNFNIRWRQHFIDTMQPKYMPVGWSVDRKEKF